MTQQAEAFRQSVLDSQNAAAQNLSENALESQKLLATKDSENNKHLEDNINKQLEEMKIQEELELAQLELEEAEKEELETEKSDPSMWLFENDFNDKEEVKSVCDDVEISTSKFGRFCFVPAPLFLCV